MPNWCEQDLRVEGSRDALIAFRDEFWTSEEKPLDDQKIMPMPEELEIPAPATMSDPYKAYYGNWRDTRAAKHDGGTTRKEVIELVEQHFDEKRRDAVLDGMSPKQYADRVRSNVKKYGFADWYEWANAKWGTKWGICDCHMEDDVGEVEEGELFYSFTSAWTPAVGLMKEASRKHPDVTLILTYFEAGVGVNGRMVFQAGQVEEHQEGPYFGSRGG